MKLSDDNAPVSEQAKRALDLALMGRDLAVGATAREKLTKFATITVERHGFSDAYNVLGTLLDRGDVRESIVKDNATEPQMKPAAAPINHTLTEVMTAAKRGDAAALEDLNRRMGLAR